MSILHRIVIYRFRNGQSWNLNDSVLTSVSIGRNIQQPHIFFLNHELHEIIMLMKIKFPYKNLLLLLSQVLVLTII